MPPRGRKPKPSHLKLVRGNPGKRPLNKNEPKPELALPMPPPHLADEAKVEWGRIGHELYQLGLLTNLDRAVLAVYCQAYARWVQAESALKTMAAADRLTGGLMIKTSNGNVVQNPLVGVANKAMADMVKYAAEFGMSPSARSRIEAARLQENPNKTEKDRASSFFD